VAVHLDEQPPKDAAAVEPTLKMEGGHGRRA
jgi:hypothetical protein